MMSTGRRCGPDDTDDNSCRDVSDRSKLSRRRALSTVGTLSLVGTAGCLDALNLGTDREEITPEPPGDEPDGTPGEFYYLLEDIDELEIEIDSVQIDREYHVDGDVYEALFLFYRSNAEDFDESDSEIMTIYQAFRELVDHGTEIDLLITDVQDGFEGQVDGWSVNAAWAEQHLNDEDIDETDIWRQIVVHGKVYEGEHRYEGADGGSIEIGGNGDLSGDDGESDDE